MSEDNSTTGSRSCGFDNRLLEPTTIHREHHDQNLIDDELFRIFRSSDTAHKWHHYFPVYTSLFGRFRSRPVRMLEIGVKHGGSLEMWRQWFHRETVLVGIDIDPSCRDLNNCAEP